MTKKDFKAIADRIAQIPDQTTRVTIAKIFADILVSINPRFDRAKFFHAANAE